MELAHRPAGPGALVLDEVLDIGAARPLTEALKARRGADLEVDASGVRRLGGLCLQALLAADAAWAADGRRLVIAAPSLGFTEALDLMGAPCAQAA